MNKAAYYQGYLQKEADLKTSLAKIFASKFWTKAAPEGASTYGIGSKVGEPVRERATSFLSKLLAKDTSTFGPGQWAWELGMPAALGVGGTAHSYANQPKDDKDMTLAALSGLGLAGMAAPGTFRYVGSNVKSAPLGHGLEALGRTALGIGAVKIGGPAALGTLKDVKRSTKNVANVSGDIKDVSKQIAEANKTTAEVTAKAAEAKAAGAPIEKSMAAISDSLAGVISSVKGVSGKASEVAPYVAALGILGLLGYGAMGYKADRSMAEQQASLPSIDVYQRKYPYLSVKELKQLSSGQAKEWAMARRNRKREAAEQIQFSQVQGAV